MSVGRGEGEREQVSLFLLTVLPLFKADPQLPI